MASKVLKSFLIGIGYDTKALEAGDKKINASLNGIKSGALGISAALIGAFGTAASSIVGVAGRVDKLAMSTQNLRTSQAAVYNYGNALKLMGGDAEDAVDTLKRFEEIQNNLRLKGDAGPINDLATAGIDVSSLYQTSTGEEFMRALAEMIPKLDEGQRAQVQSSLGLSDGVFRSLAGGVEKLDDTMKRANSLTGSVDQLTDNARKLAENSAEFGLIIDGVSNELSEKFMKSLVGAGSALNEFLKDHRGNISGAIDYAADNPGATATLLGSSVSSLVGPVISKFGLTSIGGLATKAGAVGLVGTGSAIGSNLVNQGLDKYVPGYRGVSQDFDELLKGVTGLARIPSPLDLMSGRFPGAEDQPKVSTSPSISTPPVQQIHYKEVPSQNVDDLVKAQMEARLNMDRDDPSLNQWGLDGAVSGVVDRRPPEAVYGDRSAVDSMPPQSSIDERYKDVPSQSADDLVRRIQDAKFNVHNNLTIEIDGEKLNHRIIRVNERQNYEASDDLRSTTRR